MFHAPEAKKVPSSNDVPVTGILDIKQPGMRSN